MDHPEGAGSDRADRVDFDLRVRLEFRGPIHPHRSVLASADEARKKHLIRRQDQANLPSNGRPLGGCRIKTGMEDRLSQIRRLKCGGDITVRNEGNTETAVGNVLH